jgi:hypothetical protein
VLTVKGKDASTWKKYLEEAGRPNDFLRVAPDTNEHFNFLRYETTRKTRGSGLTKNVASRFLEAIGDKELASQDPYWDVALNSLLTNSIDTVLLSGTPATVNALHATILSAPNSPRLRRSVHDASTCTQLLAKARKRSLNAEDRELLALTVTYWGKDFAALPEKTRSSIVSCFTSRATDLMRPPISRLLGDRGDVPDTFPPEASHAGKVIVLDLPVLNFGEAGRFAQRLYKTAWQEATLQRELTPDTLPVFLWVDEAHYFVSDVDARFQSTCRDFRAAGLYLAQNLSNYYAFFRARDPRAATDGFLGSLATKLFHQNSDPATNEWAERLFGFGYPDIERRSEGLSAGIPAHRDYHDAPPSRESRQYGPERRPNVDASTFMKLKRGGPPDHEAEAIVYSKNAEALREFFPTPSG